MFLARASEEIAAALDYRDALRRVAKLACPRMADWVSVEILDAGSSRLQQIAVEHVDPTKFALAQELAKRYPPDLEAPTGAPNVIRTGRSELYTEIPRTLLESIAKDAEHLRLLRELHLQSAMIVPLRGTREVFGAITFSFADDGRRYTEDDVQLAEELSKRISLMIERRRVEEQAELANRMKDEFLATVSHELRTPLQAILGYGAMLQQKVAPDPDRALAVIMRNAEAQARLIDDLLDMSRILSGKLRLKMARIELSSALTAAIDAVEPAATARDQQLTIAIGDDLGFIFGDFDRLQQIVWNLLSNAVKFTPRGGSIAVRANRIGSSVRIAVTDTGRGIPTDQLSSVFDRFRQADSSSTRAHGGLGLGLAIVKYLVEAHGGTVAAESAGPDRGSTFIVTLPTHLDALAQPTSARQAPGVLFANALKGVRVLLVDDDDDTRQFVADALAAIGASVEQSGTAAAALQLLQQQRPDVLISDIGMPHDDGYVLIRNVRALPPDRGGDVPAIALTAYARREDIVKAQEAGFQVHLAKPATVEQLLEAIKSCIP
jgi:signal transduction histidine kinase/CheY-like chemotaxis protein